MASGSEVNLVYEAGRRLADEGVSVRVVSFPSWKLFEDQDEAYRESVLPKAVEARLSVEAASPFGWERYVGLSGKIIGIDHYGASAPYKTIFEHLGFTVDNVYAQAKAVLELSQAHQAPATKGCEGAQRQ